MGYVYERLTPDDIQTLVDLKVYMPFGPPIEWCYDKEIDSWLIHLGGMGHSQNPDAIPMHLAFLYNKKLYEFTASNYFIQNEDGNFIDVYETSLIANANTGESIFGELAEANMPKIVRDNNKFPRQIFIYSKFLPRGAK